MREIDGIWLDASRNSFLLLFESWDVYIAEEFGPSMMTNYERLKKLFFFHSKAFPNVHENLSRIVF